MPRAAVLSLLRSGGGVAPHLGGLGTWRWTRARCGHRANTTVLRWAPSPGVGGARCPPPAPAAAAGLFPGMFGWEQGTEGKGHNPAQPPPPDTPTGLRCLLPPALLGAALPLVFCESHH